MATSAYTAALSEFPPQAQTLSEGVGREASPTAAIIDTQEMLWIRRKILGAAANSNARFTFNVVQGQIVGGGQLKGYMNPFAMSGGPQEIPIMVHPNMPPGTVLFLSDSVPYALNNITNVLQIRTRRDYYQTE